jgi:hypothetical protein
MREAKAVSLLVVLLISLIPITSDKSMPDLDHISQTGSRNFSVDCSGYNLQDFYQYDYADFHYTINADWSTSNLYSSLFFNGSGASDFRDKLDNFYDGLPGGNDDWISSDEVDAWNSIGPSCLSDMNSNFGIREGVPHRGGVDWNELSYVEEGIGLSEIGTVVQNHVNSRSCSSPFASANCIEIPTSSTDDIEHQIFVETGESSNMRFNQLPNLGTQNFTLAKNLTNISSANFTITFPPVSGLRIVDYTLQTNNGPFGTSFTVESSYLANGSLQINFQLTSSHPVEKNLFIDFTTEPPPFVPDIPDWTANAPVEGTIIPVGSVNYEEINSWYEGDDGSIFECSFQDAGWSTQVSSYGLEISSPEGATSSIAECSIKNVYYDMNTETRNYTFGYPFSISTDIYSVRDQVELIILPTGLVDEFSFQANAVQIPYLIWENSADDMPSSTVVGLDSTTLILQSSNLDPGPVMLDFKATAENMFDFELITEPIWYRYSLPPEIVITNDSDGNNVTWDQSMSQITVRGQVTDVDDELIIGMNVNFCGSNFDHFTRTGLNWEITLSITSCIQDGWTLYELNISATDWSGNSSYLIIDATPDSDNDGYNDHYDQFVFDSSEWYDADGDGVGDNSDMFPFDANETHDDDLDGVGNNSDAFPQDPLETLDTDSDGYGDNSDDCDEVAGTSTIDSVGCLDNDGDGWSNSNDSFIDDDSEWNDTDGDGVGDNSDDCDEVAGNSTTDSVGCLDNDGDGWSNSNDSFIDDDSEWNDTDGDGVGDNSDAFPNDDSETKDTDGDGVGDNEQFEAEQKMKNLVIGGFLLAIVIGIAGVLYFRKEKSHIESRITNIETTVETIGLKSDQDQLITPESNENAEPTVEAQWTDGNGYTWKKMSDGSTYWWDGTHWNPYDN